MKLHLTDRNGTISHHDVSSMSAPEAVRWLGSLYLWASRLNNGVHLYREVVAVELGLSADAPSKAKKVG